MFAWPPVFGPKLEGLPLAPMAELSYKPKLLSAASTSAEVTGVSDGV